ncbi:helix-turn-helix domain-containing protein [Kitasatospora sp. NPDC048365]|uniref:helix-turn-helix domain-containing protein n=1 Tax=Kitasatospora sp. NPDC048365 TaxID=3364050 RepID=UPI00371701AD
MGHPAGGWESFGACLRSWRRRAGYTQAQLGAAIGYDHTAVSRLEHGARRATPRLALRLDELLGAGGELADACGAAERIGREGSALAEPLTRMPLPVTGGEDGAVGAGFVPRELPEYGLLCPLHGAEGCELPSGEDVLALHAEFCAGSRAGVDADTVHALAGVLVAWLRAAEPTAGPPRDTPARPTPAAGPERSLEGTLRVVLGRLAASGARERGVWAHLAAEYAHAAGTLRMQRGRGATAMVCFDRALGWAELAGDALTQVAALSDMAVLSLLDGDPSAAAGFAREISRVAPGRHWSGALSQLGLARAEAAAGDVRAVVRHVGRARLHLDHLDGVAESAAPWLAAESLRLRVESGAAAALRDVAVLSGDVRFARRALGAAQTALELLGEGQLPSARMMLAVRAADCRLCAGDPAAAVEVLAPVLAEAAGSGLPVLVRHEVRGLRDRLAERAAGPEAAETVRRLGTLL